MAEALHAETGVYVASNLYLCDAFFSKYVFFYLTVCFSGFETKIGSTNVHIYASLEKCYQGVRRVSKSFRWSPSDPSDTSRFHRTCGVFVRKTLRKMSSSRKKGFKIVPMESGHRIHRTRIDSIGHVEFLFVRHLEKCYQAVRRGRKSFRWSPSDPSYTNRFHRTCTVSVRKTLSRAWRLKVVSMDSIGSIGHE